MFITVLEWTSLSSNTVKHVQQIWISTRCLCIRQKHTQIKTLYVRVSAEMWEVFYIHIMFQRSSVGWEQHVTDWTSPLPFFNTSFNLTAMVLNACSHLLVETAFRRGSGAAGEHDALISLCPQILWILSLLSLWAHERRTSAFPLCRSNSSLGQLPGCRTFMSCIPFNKQSCDALSSDADVERDGTSHPASHVGPGTDLHVSVHVGGSHGG